MYAQSYLINGQGSHTQVIDASSSSRGSVSTPKPRRVDHMLNQTKQTSTPPSSSSSKLRRMKAAESGSGSLLPDYNSSNNNTPTQQRVRTFSDFSLRSHSQDSGGSAPSSPNSGQPNLRRRASLKLDDDTIRHLQRRNSNGSGSSSASLPMHSAPRRTTPIVAVNRKFTLQHLFQSVVILTIFYLIYDAHSKVQEASLRLEHYKDEESLLINQMDRIEGRAMQLQEQLKRLREEHMNPVESPVEQTRAETHALQKEVQHWKRQADEVDKEVAALQDFMQHGARQEIAARYGTGSVHVNVALGLDGSGPAQLTLELFDETPHAAWVYLQQIANGDWAGSNFIWHPSHMILASPAKSSTTKLEFVERSVHAHQAWTVGLTPSDNGGYNFYINLQDNSHVHEGDVCFGKIVGGFDALQRLMHVDTVARQTGGERTYLEPPVSINDFSVSTVKRPRARR